MRILRRGWCAAALLVLAFPLAVRAQGPGDPRAAGIDLGGAALDLQSAAQQILPGTPCGDAVLRALQQERGQIDEFRAAMDVGRSPAVVRQRFARLVDAHRQVQGNLMNLRPGVPGNLAHRLRRYERAFANLVALMGRF